MRVRRGVVGPLVGAVVVVVAALVAVAWWVGGGQFGAASGAGRVVRPGDVPACGPAWRVADAPNPSKAYDEMHALAASSASDIWGVGTFGTEEFALTLIEHWDGAAWRQVPSPSVPGYSNHLYGVAARSADDAWAVGASHQGTDLWRTLALHWDGKAWSVVHSPNVGPISALNAVVALAGDDVWAVGESSMGSKGSGSRPLVEHWDGKTWSIVPIQGAHDGALNAVAALSGEDIWAAGSAVDASGNIERPVFLHWDGKAWNSVAMEGAQGTVWALAAVGADEVWAVGNNGPQALAFRWDGSRWKAMPAPNPSQKSNALSGVAATGQGGVWAVGSQRIGGAGRPLAARWDGKGWIVAASPSVGDYEDALNAVVALSSGEAWAAGSTIADAQGTNHLLVERYSEPCR